MQKPSSPDQLSEALAVVGSFYDSILDESLWKRACESFADYCGGTATAVISASNVASPVTRVRKAPSAPAACTISWT